MDNKIGFHANYFRDTPYATDVFAMADCIAAAGGRAIEVMPYHLSLLTPEEACRFRDHLELLGVELIVGAGRTPQTDASSSDKAIQEASFRESCEMLERLRLMGCHKWVGLIHATLPGHPTEILTTAKKAEIVQRSVDGMKRILPMADRYGIDLCFEVVSRFYHYLLNTAEEGVAFCRQLDHPRAKLLLDVAHMNIEEGDMCRAIEDTIKAGCLAHFHVAEANRAVPGDAQTHIDWDGIFKTLAQNRYEGPIIVESFLLNGNQFANAAANWRDMSGGASFEELLNKVNIGIGFVRDGMARATKETLPVRTNR